MRRRYVLALVLATALIFALAGTAFGHYVVPRSKSDSAQCLATRHAIDTGQPDPVPEAYAYYDANCR
jgi:hypothetical protein